MPLYPSLACFLTMFSAILCDGRPFNAKNPFLGKITKNVELFATEADRSCRHIEIDISGSGLRYFAGDHVAIHPTNNEALVVALAERLQLDLDQVFSLKATDGAFICLPGLS